MDNGHWSTQFILHGHLKNARNFEFAHPDGLLHKVEGQGIAALDSQGGGQRFGNQDFLGGLIFVPYGDLAFDQMGTKKSKAESS